MGARVRNMEVFLLDGGRDLDPVCTVLLELRPQYTLESIREAVLEQLAEGYRVAYVKHAGEVVAAAGFVISRKLAWGKHIYVDDLVTAEHCRSGGAGKLLISWLKQFGRENDCVELHLDSGVQRFAAHGFYLREGFHISSHHFTLTDLQGDSGSAEK